MKHFFTFVADHPLGNNWIEMEATSIITARDEMARLFNMKWAFQYTEENFDPSYFPGGRAGQLHYVV